MLQVWRSLHPYRNEILRAGSDILVRRPALKMTIFRSQSGRFHMNNLLDRAVANVVDVNEQIRQSAGDGSNHQNLSSASGAYCRESNEFRPDAASHGSIALPMTCRADELAAVDIHCLGTHGGAGMSLVTRGSPDANGS